MFIVHWGSCNLTKDFDSVVFVVLFVFSEISGGADLVQASLVTRSQVLDISYFSFRITFPTCINTFKKPRGLAWVWLLEKEGEQLQGEKIHLCSRFSSLTQIRIPHVNYGKAISDIPENNNFIEVSLLPSITKAMIANVLQWQSTLTLSVTETVYVLKSEGAHWFLWGCSAVNFARKGSATIQGGDSTTWSLIQPRNTQAAAETDRLCTKAPKDTGACLATSTQEIPFPQHCWFLVASLAQQSPVSFSLHLFF